MSTDEIIEYLTTYIKACKIKGNPFIVVYMGYLYLLDEMMSALYIVEIDHANNLIIATTYKEMVDKKNIGLNFAIYNNVGAIIHNYISFPKEKFSRLTRTDTDYEIPSRSTDNAKLTKYYLDNDGKNMSVGDTIRYHMTRLDMTVESLSERTGLGIRTIIGLRNNSCHAPKLETILAVVVGLGLEDMFCFHCRQAAF